MYKRRIIIWLNIIKYSVFCGNIIEVRLKTNNASHSTGFSVEGVILFESHERWKGKHENWRWRKIKRDWTLRRWVVIVGPYCSVIRIHYKLLIYNVMHKYKSYRIHFSCVYYISLRPKCYMVNCYICALIRRVCTDFDQIDFTAPFHQLISTSWTTNPKAHGIY